MDKNSRLLLQFSLIEGIGPRSVLSFLLSVTGVSKEDLWYDIRSESGIDLRFVYQFSTVDFVRHTFSEHQARAVVAALSDMSAIEKIEQIMEREAIRWVSWFDNEYPSRLWHIHAPPLGLYVKGGSISSSNNVLGVVGSRMAGLYAERVIEQVLKPFVMQNGVIVSGGALGVDGMAHAIAVTYKKPTIVVLGSGLLSLYPRQHYGLFEKVLAMGGSLVSPFGLEVGPEKFNFPIRNRIIAGLSEAVLVVQAASKSGALITAEYAMQEGRSVMAIPGHIDDILSAGCHSLLKQGAALIVSYDDLAAEMGIVRGVDAVTDSSEKNVSIVEKVVDPLLELLQKAEYVESLAAKLQQSVDEVEDRLFMLQLEGVVMQRVNGSWIRV